MDVAEKLKELLAGRVATVSPQEAKMMLDSFAVTCGRRFDCENIIKALIETRDSPTGAIFIVEGLKS